MDNGLFVGMADIVITIKDRKRSTNSPEKRGEKRKMESMTFVLFGATGDLAKRKIFPALYNLYVDQKLPQVDIDYWTRERGTFSFRFSRKSERIILDFSRRLEHEAANMGEFLDHFATVVWMSRIRKNINNYFN